MPKKAGIEQFASDFLDPNLRHSFFDESDFELNLNLPLLDSGSISMAPSARDRPNSRLIRLDFGRLGKAAAKPLRDLIAETGSR